MKMPNWITSMFLFKSFTAASESILRELYGGRQTKSGVTMSADQALQITTVLACVRVISEGLAQVPLKVYKRTEKSKDEQADHPLYPLLHDAPNPWMTSFEMFETLGMHAALAGNGYAYITRTANGRILEMLPLLPTSVSVEQLPNQWDIAYKVTLPSGEQVTLDRDSIWHWRGPSWDAVAGMDAVRYLREAMGLAVAAEEMSSRSYSNGARPSGVLSTVATLSDKQLKDLREAWKQNYEGAGNAFRTLLLHGDYKFTPMSGSMADAQLIESRKMQIEEICRGMRVQPIMIGYQQGTGAYASVEQMFLAHVVHTMGPWYRRIEQSANMTLLSRAERRQGMYTKFVVNALMRGSMAERIAYYNGLYNIGSINPNEIRAFEEMPPREGGDEFMSPLNMQGSNPNTGAPQPGNKPAGPRGRDLRLVANGDQEDDDSGKALSLDPVADSIAGLLDWIEAKHDDDPVAESFRQLAKAFDPDQPRDEYGRWTSDGGGGSELGDGSGTGDAAAAAVAQGMSGVSYQPSPGSARSTSEMLLSKSPEEVREMLGLKPGKNSVPEVYRALQAYSNNHEMSIAPTDFSPAAAEAMSDSLAHEIASAVSSSDPDLLAAKDWYSKAYPEAVKLAGQHLYPELATDPNAVARMTAFTAISSNGEKPERNGAIMLDIYEQVRSGVPYKDVQIDGRRESDVYLKLQRWGKLEERLGGAEAAQAYLLERVKAGEYASSAEGRAFKVNNDYPVDMEVPRGALLFGAKLGAFHANLAGENGYLTMDMWWSRTVNRIRGAAVVETPSGPGSAFEKWKGTMPNEQAASLTLDRALDQATPYERSYRARGHKTELEVAMGRKEGTNAAKRAEFMKQASEQLGAARFASLKTDHDREKIGNTLVKSGLWGIQETPYTSKDREFQAGVVRQAVAKLNSRGANLNVAAAQAVSWIYEQKLASKITGKDLQSGDFFKVIRNEIERRAKL